jgi:hypothetical protein
MKLFYLVFFLVIRLTIITAQNEDKIPIILSYDYIINKHTLTSKCLSTYLVEIKEDSTFLISERTMSGIGKLHDFKGALNITIEDKELGLYIVGQYVNGLDLLKKQVEEYNPHLDSSSVVVISYYKPLPHGEWYYYSLKKKKLLYKLNFDKGIWLYNRYMRPKN